MFLYIIFFVFYTIILYSFITIFSTFLTHFYLVLILTFELFPDLTSPLANQSTNLIVHYLRPCGAVAASVYVYVHRVCSENVTTACGQQSTNRRWRLRRASHQFGIAAAWHSHNDK